MWFNPIMTWLLRSPLHPILSKNTLLVSYTGRKSGRRYAIPVNYLRQGSQLTTLSDHQRTWWRNLRGGAQVSLRLAGHDRRATAEVQETEAAVGAALEGILRNFPQYARYLKIPFGAGGQPNPEALRRAAAAMVVVLFQLSDENVR